MLASTSSEAKFLTAKEARDKTLARIEVLNKKEYTDCITDIELKIKKTIEIGHDWTYVYCDSDSSIHNKVLNHFNELGYMISIDSEDQYNFYISWGLAK